MYGEIHESFFLVKKALVLGAVSFFLDSSEFFPRRAEAARDLARAHSHCHRLRDCRASGEARTGCGGAGGI